MIYYILILDTYAIFHRLFETPGNFAEQSFLAELNH